MTTSNPWANLRAMLEKQTKQYERLLDLMKKKERELIKGDTAKLSRTIKEEEKFINELEKLENKRLRAAMECLPGAKEPPQLEELLAAAPDPEKEPLEKAALALMQTLNSLSASNRLNAELTKESMNYITYNINLLSSDRTRDNLYEGTGRIKGAEPKVRGILNKEA